MARLALLPGPSYRNITAMTLSRRHLPALLVASMLASHLISSHQSQCRFGVVETTRNQYAHSLEPTGIILCTASSSLLISQLSYFNLGIIVSLLANVQTQISDFKLPFFSALADGVLAEGCQLTSLIFN
jgi:hypothetical protein